MMMMEAAPICICLIVIVVFIIILIVIIARFKAMWCMAAAEGLDMVLERPLVFEIRSTDAEPKLAAILFMGAPVSTHCKGLAALVAVEGFVPVLPLVVGLQSSKVLERLGARVFDVVLAPLSTAVARHSQHCGRRLCSLQRIRALSVL